MKSSNILFAPIRAQFFFLRVPNFLDFLDLCVVSNPSPLDDNAPWTSKVILLLIGGSVEYMGLCFLSDLLDINRHFFGFLIAVAMKGWSNGKWQPDESPDRVYHLILGSLLAMCFWIRLKALTRRQAAGKLRHNFILTFLSLNPALVWHVLLVALMRPVKLDSTRIRVLKLLWGFMAPAVDIPVITSSWFGRKDTAESIKEMKSYLDTGFGAIAYKSAKITITEMILKRIPWVLIQLALYSQSQVYLRTRGRATNTGERWKWQSKLARLNKAYRMVESMFTWALSVALGRVATAIAAILRRSLGPLIDQYATKPVRRSTVQPAPSSARIRLLYLLPSSSDADVIECSMKWHEVSSLPAYTAVSYAWGSNAFSHSIVVNDTREEVTQSAHEVLANLRSRWRTRILWIDAICIKQSDASDKAEQIPLMPTIYERAARTVVWLGPSKTAALAVSLVSRLFLINRLSVAWKSNLSYEIDPPAARSLLDMLERPWFTRTWVVQEVVRAKDVSILYGCESLSWSRLSWFLQVVQRDNQLLQMLSERSGSANFANLVSMQNMTIMRRFSMLRSDSEPLSLLFYMVQMFRTVEARFDSKYMEDRVYALLGLSGSNTHSITPEYEKGLGQIYIDAARHFGTNGPQSRRLEFLVHAGIGYKPVTAGLPTWVPDWAAKLKIRPLPGTDGTAEMLLAPPTDVLLKDAAGLATKGTYIVGDDDQEEAALVRIKAVRDQILASLPNCAPGTTPSLCFHPDNTLTVRGRRFSRIRGVGLVYPGSGGNVMAAISILSGWALLATSVARRVNPYGTANLPEFFMQTVLNNCDEPSFDYTFTTSPVGRVHVSVETRVGEVLLFVHLAKMTLTSVTDPAVIRATHSLVRGVDRFCVGRVFAVTDSGHFGLFMEGTKEGDWVCLLDGLSLPVSLREAGVEDVATEDCSPPRRVHDLVGPAYIRGILNGEGLQQSGPPEDFMLR